MLNREKTWNTTINVESENTFYSFEPNIRITLVEDPSVSSFKGYNHSSVYSDGSYCVSYGDSPLTDDDIYTSICGSVERLNDSAPHIHLFCYINYTLLFLPEEETMLKIDEPWDKVYVIDVDSLEIVSEFVPNTEYSTSNMYTYIDTATSISEGTYNYLFTNEEIKKSLAFPAGMHLHLDIDLSDDCQYIKVTHVNPVAGENTFNFTVIAKGQNDAGKYVYDIHWWGWFKEYYNTIEYNTMLTFFQTEDLLPILSGDGDNTKSELACIGVIPPAGAKKFDFTTTVETDNTLHMAKYKDVLKFDTVFDGTNWIPQ